VQRRLRHLMRARLGALPGGALAVVRALPAAAGASSATLGADLDAALRRLGNPPVDSSADSPVAARHGSG
jgi:ribonuclease P protein component